MIFQEEHWDFKKNTPKRNCPDKDTILAIIEKRTARKSILLIDNYVDDSVLLMLGKRDKGVTATI